MKKIKKFNELFDTEELRSEHEIDYMKGTLGQDIISGKEGTKWWARGKKTMNFLLSELIESDVHQLLLFVARPKLPGIRIITSRIKQSRLPLESSEKDANKIFYTFILERKDLYILMGIKIVADNNYELVIISDRESDNDHYVLHFENLTLDKLVKHLKYDWLEYISQFGQEVLNFGKDSVRNLRN